MILNEIALDLPYIANEENIDRIMISSKCDREFATRQDYEENWKSKRRTLVCRLDVLRQCLKD